MFNKLHYDAKFQEMIAPATAIASTSITSVDTGDKDICVTGADRVAILLNVLAASVIKNETIMLYKCNAGGTGDTAIAFDICEINEATGAYGTWYAGTAAAGYTIYAGADTTEDMYFADGSHMYLIEVDKSQFIGDDDFATPLEYLTMKITAEDADETGTISGSAIAILYGLKYKNED